MFRGVVGCRWVSFGVVGCRWVSFGVVRCFGTSMSHFLSGVLCSRFCAYQRLRDAVLRRLPVSYGEIKYSRVSSVDVLCASVYSRLCVRRCACDITAEHIFARITH